MKTFLTGLAAALLLVSSQVGAQARVAVLHLAPFADTLDGTAVDVNANGAPLLMDLRFGDFTESYVEVPAGTYDIDVVPVGATEPAISGTFDLEDGVDYTLFAAGDGANQPLQLVPLVDDNSPPEDGNLKLRIVHAAPFADTLPGTEVSIRGDGGDLVAGLQGVPFGADSGFLEIPAGNYDLKVSSNDGLSNFIDVAPVDLPAGAVLTVFATGDGSNQPLGALAFPLGDLPLEIPVDSSLTGWWEPVDMGTTLTGQGIVTLALPGEDRMVGTIYTFSADGSQQNWFTFDSCATMPGETGCASPGAFRGDSVSAAVYLTSGGAFLQPGTDDPVQAGTLDIEFDPGCRTGNASLLLTGEAMPIEFAVDRIETPLGCNIPE